MSDRTLITLGLFIFGMDSLAYSELSRSREWRHATSERFGARDAAQYVGPGKDSISLSGSLCPEIAGKYSSIDRLVEMSATGDNWPLVDGSGKVWGNFRILHIDERQSAIISGGLARKTDFTIDLERAD